MKKKDNLSVQIKKDLPYWLALSQVNGIGPKTFVALIKKFGSAESVWMAKEETLAKAVDKNVLNRFIKDRKEIIPEKLLEVVVKKQIQILTLVDKNYPKNLLTIYDPPPVLYIKGEILKEDEQALAVVGSRRMTSYGKEATRRLVNQLVGCDLTIVSGLARGIDGVAHETAIENKGRTIAVLGCGVDIIYPFENRILYKKIMAGFGAIISEFAPQTQPQPGYFPQRNRIIAGLSLGVLVVEAAERSGSLITANFAIDFGREVFAVPGPINYPTSWGTANLIKQGAKLVTSVDDVLEELKIKKEIKKIKKQTRSKNETKEEALILKILENEPKHIDVIVQESKLSSAKIMATLSLLELAGFVKQLDRGVFEVER